MKKILMEFIATFLMLLAILESIAIAAGARSAMVTLLTSTIVSGAAVTVLIYIFGKRSGAHLNPAVSTAMWLDNQLKTGLFFGYAIAQLAGSWLAAWVIDVTHQEGSYLMGETIPTQTETVAWFIELASSFVLIMVIFRFTDERFPKMKKFGAIAIGLTVAIGIYITGPYSGGSMNPARSFGPAMIENQRLFLWIYFIAPMTAAAVARYFDLWLRKRIGKKAIDVQTERVIKEEVAS